MMVSLGETTNLDFWWVSRSRGVSDSWDDTGQTEQQSEFQKATSITRQCDSDSSLWMWAWGDDGKCYNFCTLKPDYRFEIDKQYCAGGEGQGKVAGKQWIAGVPNNIVLIAGAALAYMVLNP